MMIKWYELTKNQFSEYKANSVVAINFSSTEQHSNYLPVGTDGILGEAVLFEAARRAKSNVVVMPSVYYGYSPHHKFAPGYVTIDQSTLVSNCKDIGKCVYENGFKKLVLLNSHGGNMAYLQFAVNELGEKYENLMEVALFKYWDLISSEIAQARESAIGGMGHACEFETSMMMYLRPELVDRNAIIESPPAKGDPYYEPGLLGRKKYSKFVSFNKYNPNGNLGQEQYASAEKGKIFYEAAASAAADFFDFWCLK